MNNNDTMSYNQAMERLEEIMNSIQSGVVDIEKLTDALQESDTLIKFCHAKLHKVDEDVKALLQNIASDGGDA